MPLIIYGRGGRCYSRRGWKKRIDRSSCRDCKMSPLYLKLLVSGAWQLARRFLHAELSHRQQSSLFLSPVTKSPFISFRWDGSLLSVNKPGLRSLGVVDWRCSGFMHREGRLSPSPMVLLAIKDSLDGTN